MGRIILVLTAACLLATLLIIGNSSFKTNYSPSPKADDAGKKAEKGRPMKGDQDSRGKITRKRTVNRSRPYIADNSKKGSVELDVNPEEENNQDAAHAIVKGDYTPVYSVNSRDSSIVKLLKKGDKVATDVEVIDGQGRWTVVKKEDLTRPGFVLGETLQRPGTTKKTGNKK